MCIRDRIRAPQGSLQGVSGFQVRIGAKDVYNSGDKADVLVAMNPAALKMNAQYLKRGSIVIYDTDSFEEKDLEKANFQTQEPFKELGLEQVHPIGVAITSLTKASLEDSGMEGKDILRSKNMFALGLVCWLFNRPLEIADQLLQQKFAKKQAVVKANVKALTDGYNYGPVSYTHLDGGRGETAKRGVLLVQGGENRPRLYPIGRLHEEKRCTAGLHHDCRSPPGTLWKGAASQTWGR